MQFDNTYFENEIRDGFFIPGMVKRSWAVQMEVLEVVADICKRHDIKWFADYGTLIGAMRHKGFVPWDDDLDICMLRDDYSRFYHYAKEELPKEYCMMSVEDTIGYENFLLRVTKGDSIKLNNEFLLNNYGFPYCAGIDIFPLDYLYKDTQKEEIRVQKVKKMVEFAGLQGEELTKEQKKDLIKRIEAHVGLKVDKTIPLQDAMVRIVDQLYKEASREEADRVAMMHFYTINGSQIRPLEYYEHSIEVPFETGTICVPARYDEVLNLEYGNWGIANRRGGLHDYPFFTEQEEILRRKGERVPYRFSLPINSVVDEIKRKEHFYAYDHKANILHTIHDVHTMIAKLINQEDFEDAMNLCGRCQELAVFVGNSIEETFGENTEIVSKLENYCEELFQLYELLSVADREAALLGNSKHIALLDTIEMDYKLYFCESDEILFLPVRFSDWDCLENMYLDEVRKNGDKVFVMPLPYYERENDGSIGKGHYDIDCFTSDIRLLDYRKSDFFKKHYKRIYFVNPYDAFQSGMTVDPSFYSETLHDYCNELILVDHLGVTNPLDEKTMENLKHYVLTPGMMRADKVLVPDEESKEAFEKILKLKRCQKEIGVDSKIKGKRVFHKESGEKKKLLFYVCIADFYANPKEIFSWISRRIQIFSETGRGMHVDYVEPVCFQDKFLKDYPEHKKNYEKIVKDIRCLNLGSIISETEAEERLDDYDAYYGSPGYLLNQCALRGKTAMIRNLGM